MAVWAGNNLAKTTTGVPKPIAAAKIWAAIKCFENTIIIPKAQTPDINNTEMNWEKGKIAPPSAKVMNKYIK